MPPISSSLTKEPVETRANGAFGRYLTYGVLCGLLLFEALNYFGVFKFNVEYTWLGRVVSTAVVLGVLFTLNQLSKKQLGEPIHGYIFFSALGLILIDFVGDVFQLYGRWEHYDQLAHFLSGPFLVGSFYLFYVRMSADLKWRQPQIMNYLLAFQTSVTFAALYEMEEYLEDVFFGSHRSGGGVDTADDLTLNIVGGVLTLLVILGYRAWKKRAQRIKQ